MTTEKLEEIKAESIAHSNNLADWNIEALIKEMLWATYHGTKVEGILMTGRESMIYQELRNRIADTFKDDVTNHALAYSTLRTLVVEQEKCTNPTYSHTNRNKALREFENIMKVRTIISDILLP